MLGLTMLPSVSLPIENPTSPAAVAAPGPALDPDAVFSTEQPPIPEPEKATIGQKRRDEIAALVLRAGLTLNERHFEQLCATAPYIDDMTGRLERDPAFHDEPSNIFIA